MDTRRDMSISLLSFCGGGEIRLPTEPGTFPPRYARTEKSFEPHPHVKQFTCSPALSRSSSGGGEIRTHGPGKGSTV